MIWGRIRERRRRLAFLGGTVASVALWGSLSWSEWPSEPWPVVALVVVAAWLAWWTTLGPARVAHDLTTPVTVATGVLAGPDAVFRVLVLQAILIALVDGLARRRSPSAVLANSGIQVAWQLGLSTGLYLLLTWAGSPSPRLLLPFAAGMALATAAATTLNYWSVRLAVRYLYGPPSEPMESELAVLTRDVAASTLLGVTVWYARTSIWVPMIGIALAGVVVFDQFQRARERAYAQARRLQARIRRAEQAGLEGHTPRVVAMLEELLGGIHGRARRRAIAAAWCHGIAVAGRPGRCAGIAADPEHVELMRALPSGLLVEHTLNTIVGGYVGPNADTTAAWIAAACALDSTRHHPAAVARRHISGVLHISAETLATVSRAEEMLRREGTIDA